ncbi:MAG: protein TolQ [Candidatus Pelagibacter sp.]|nr:protein TolQ [Candidatus Pelagibacter sp.]OUV97934.1 MAG: protein TolQ [Candidatus Pelagibacter sp. TMED142]|tara:strand:- start:225 stop:899 length:675 start_codon:yes stop_codon:yes gene_type:complete
MDQVTTGAATIATTDFSIITLFMRADLIVKSVIILLIVSSIYSWALIFEKHKIFKRINLTSSDFEEKFWSSKSAQEIFKKTSEKDLDPMTKVFRAGMSSLNDNKNKGTRESNEIVKRMMDVAIDKEIEIYEKNLTILATIGSVAPFVGLFGTVWGIMNSFQSIAISRNTSLAIVAPGIAEALFATALGLLAAIPAVVAFNKYSNSSRVYTQKLENFSRSFLTII